MEGVQDGKDHMAEVELPKLSRMDRSSILESFSKLESSGENLRITAGVALLRQLFDKQHENEASICIDLNYSLTRLIRGMGTLKKEKRCGYFSALVGILSEFPEVTVKDVLTKMEKELTLGNHGYAKSEVTEVNGGLILVCGALVHSGLFFKGTLKEQELLLGNLLNAGEKKNIFSQAVSSFFMDICYKVDNRTFKNVVWPCVEKHLIKPWKACTAHTLHMLLIASKRHPKMPKETLIEIMGTSDVVNEESLPHICEILMNTPITTTYEHPVYEAICHTVASKDMAFTFWDLSVGEYQKQSSRSRELVLIVLLQYLLKHYPDKGQVFRFMTSGFIELAMKAFQTTSKCDIVKKLQKIFTTLLGLLEDDSVEDKSRISFIKCILLHPGHVMFDKLSGTRIVLSLCSCLKLEGVKEVAELYRCIITAEKPKKKGASGETLPWNKGERIYAAYAFTRLLSLPTVQEDLDWKVDQTKFLISIGLVASPSRDGDIMHFAVAGKVKECIYKVLNQRMSKLDQLCSFLSSIVNYLNDIVFSTEEHGKIRQPLTESSVAAWHKMIKVVQHLSKLQNREGQHRGSIKSLFHILFLHMGLQLFNNASLAEESLQELHCCYERINESEGPSSKKKNKMAKDMKPEEIEEPYWADVVVDLFLSLLSHNSHLLRNVVNVVFPHLCPHLTASAFHQILQVLNPYAKRLLSSTESGESGADKSESEEDDDGASTNAEDDDADDDSDESACEDLNEDEPVNLHLKSAVQKALGQIDGGSDAESIDVDDIPEEDGRRLDAALSEAFKLLKHTQADSKKNKKQSKDDETLMHFRVRVLDLLDFYLNTEPSLALILDMLLPLFELLEFCIRDPHQRPLENKVRTCLRKLSDVKHVANREGVDQQLLSDVLKMLLQKGERAAAVFQTMGRPLVASCTFLARASYQLAQEQPSTPTGHKSKTSPVEKVYKEALISFFKQRDSLLPFDVFKFALRLQWNGAWRLVPCIVDFAFNPNIRPYRRHQALELLLVFYSNSRLLNDASEKQKNKLYHLEEKLSKEAISVLQASCVSEDKGGGTGVKDRFVRELFHLLTVLWHAQKKYKHTQQNVDWLAVKNAAVLYWQASACDRETKSAFKKFSSVAGISVTNQKKKALSVAADEVNIKEEPTKSNAVNGASKKRHHESSSTTGTSVQNDSSCNDRESGEDKSEDVKVRRKKDGKEIYLLKKMSREAREAAMAEGLDTSFSFSQITLPSDKLRGKKRKGVMDVHNGYVNGEVKKSKLKKEKKLKRDMKCDKKKKQGPLVKKIKT